MLLGLCYLLIHRLAITALLSVNLVLQSFSRKTSLVRMSMSDKVSR